MSLAGPAPPRAVLASLALALGLGGCTVHAVDPTPAPGIAMPARFSLEEAAEPSTGAFVADAALAALIRDGLAASPRIAAAAARLARADAMVGEARAARLPAVSADIGSTSVFASGRPNDTTGAASLRASLPVDLFGEIGAGIGAARADASATAYDLAETRLALAHDIARAYFDAIEQRRRDALLDEQITVARKLLRITEVRFGQGAGSLADILQQREQLASLEAQRPGFSGALRVAENRLDVLLGAAPDGADRTVLADFPLPAAGLALGAPASLLNRRPDIRAAEARLVAADYRLAVAVADFFPQFDLIATGAINALANPGVLVWSAVAQATQTIFAGGRRQATLDRQGAAVDENAALFAETWLAALEEVENAAFRERTARATVVRLEDQRALGAQALAATRTRYVQGAVSFVTVLSTLQSLQATESALIGARRRLLDERLGLLRALGLTPTGAPVLQAGEPQGEVRSADLAPVRSEGHAR